MVAPRGPTRSKSQPMCHSHDGLVHARRVVVVVVDAHTPRSWSMGCSRPSLLYTLCCATLVKLHVRPSVVCLFSGVKSVKTASRPCRQKFGQLGARRPRARMVRLDAHVSSLFGMKQSEARVLIVAGEVGVHGAPQREPRWQVVLGEEATVTVAGRAPPTGRPFAHRLLLVHKPRGVLCERRRGSAAWNAAHGRRTGEANSAAHGAAHPEAERRVTDPPLEPGTRPPTDRLTPVFAPRAVRRYGIWCRKISATRPSVSSAVSTPTRPVTPELQLHLNP